MKLHPLMVGYAQSGAVAASCLLLGCAAEPAVQESPKTWFQQTQLDLGKIRDKNELTATFSFVNPTGKLQKWFSFLAD